MQESKELERICHKALAKRASERYSSAHDFAEDLRLFFLEQTVIQRHVAGWRYFGCLRNARFDTGFNVGRISGRFLGVGGIRL